MLLGQKSQVCAKRYPQHEREQILEDFHLTVTGLESGKSRLSADVARTIARGVAYLQGERRSKILR